MSSEAAWPGAYRKLATEQLPVRAMSPEETQSEIVAAMAARIRRAYTREWIIFAGTQRQLAGNVKSEPKHWRKAALRIIDSGLDPELYVLTCFIGGRPPFPSQLVNKGMLTRHADIAEHWRQNMQQLLPSRLNTFKVAVTHVRVSNAHKTARETWREVLLNNQLELCPLFRYCVAVAEHIDDVCAYFEESAAMQYLRDPAGYALLWNGLLPAGLAQKAAFSLHRD